MVSLFFVFIIVFTSILFLSGIRTTAANDQVDTASAKEQQPPPQVVRVGDAVPCIEGYVMDYHSIKTGYLVDNPSVQTLEHPEQHSINTLIGVPICLFSKFEILLDPSSVVEDSDVIDGSSSMLNTLEDTGNHDEEEDPTANTATATTLYRRGYRLDYGTKMAVIEIAENLRSVAIGMGLCQTEGCDGSEDSWLSGLRVVIHDATVIELTDEDGEDAPPTITAQKEDVAYANPLHRYCSSSSDDATANNDSQEGEEGDTIAGASLGNSPAVGTSSKQNGVDDVASDTSSVSSTNVIWDSVSKALVVYSAMTNFL